MSIVSNGLPALSNIRFVVVSSIRLVQPMPRWEPMNEITFVNDMIITITIIVMQRLFTFSV